MPNVGTVTFDIAAESAKLRSELDKVKKQVGGLHAVARNFESGLKKIGGVLAGAFAVGAVVGFARQVNQAADRLNDLSQRLGVSASRLNVIELAATQAGASTEAVATAMAKLTENVGSAAMVNKAAAAAISTLKLSTQDLLQLRPDQAFEAVTAALSKIPNEFQRAALAQDLFGKGAKELSQFFREGTSAIETAQAALERHGAALNDIDIAKIGVMNDDLAAQGIIVQNLGIKMLSNFSPAVGVAVESFSNLIGAVGGATEAGKSMGVVFVAVIKIIEAAAQTLIALFEGIRSVVAGVVGVILAGWEKIASGLAFVAEKLGMEGVAGKLSAVQEAVSGIKESMFAISVSSAEHAQAAWKSAGAAALGVLNAAEIFDKASAELDKRAAAAAARAGGGGAITPAGGEGATSRILAEGGALSGGGATGNVRVEGPNEFRFDEMTRQIYADNLQALKDAGVLRQEEWDRQLNDMGIALGNSISYQTGLEAAKYETWGSLAGQFVGLIGNSNKRMAKLQQGLAIAQAIWWTASGVTNALRSLPFPANIAAAAKVAVMGALQVAKIKAAKYSAGGSSGGGSFSAAGGSAGGSEGQFETPAAVAQQQPTRMAQVIIQGDVFSSTQTVDYLIDKIREAINDRDVSVISSRSRQAFDLGAT